MTGLDDATRAQLTMLLQPDVAPTLTADEVAGIESVAAVRGIVIALFYGWSAKTAKAAPKVDVKAGDVTKSGSQLYAQCAAQRDYWSTLAGLSATTTPARSGFRSVPTRRS